MGDALLRDLWFPNAEGVLIEDVVVDDELVIVRANASVERAECPACGTLSAFAEQADGLTFRHGRRSAGLQAVLQRLAVMLAGRAGARLAHALAVRASRSTHLWLIHRRPACQAHRTDVTAHAVNARSCPVDSAGRRPTHQPASSSGGAAAAFAPRTSCLDDAPSRLGNDQDEAEVLMGWAGPVGLDSGMSANVLVNRLL
ncbi:hypothetical protein [Streptomyces sp. NPDC093591]|uniref:hypothetical protein n=1 Tax=Streptomyces sp. NPDC093591 TaxID=3366044 RepID=UPI00382EDBEB